MVMSLRLDCHPVDCASQSLAIYRLIWLLLSIGSYPFLVKLSAKSNKNYEQRTQKCTTKHKTQNNTTQNYERD